jgi:hypothetical protein
MAEGVPLETLVTKAEEYATAMAGSEWAKWLHTWLTQEGWLETPTSVVARKKERKPAGKKPRDGGRHKESGVSRESVVAKEESRPATPKPKLRVVKGFIKLGGWVWHADGRFMRVTGFDGASMAKVSFRDPVNGREVEDTIPVGRLLELSPERLAGMPGFIQIGEKVWDAAGAVGHVEGIERQMVRVRWSGIGSVETHYKELLQVPPAPPPKLPWSTPVLLRQAPPLPSYIRPGALACLRDGTGVRVCIDGPLTDDEGLVRVMAEDEWGSLQQLTINPEDFLCSADEVPDL